MISVDVLIIHANTNKLKYLSVRDTLNGVLLKPFGVSPKKRVLVGFYSCGSVLHVDVLGIQSPLLTHAKA